MSSGANPYKGTTPTADNPLDAAVWFGTTSGTYPEGSASTLPRRTTVSFKSSDLTFPDVILKYPASGSVYAVGLYPQTGWTPNAENATAATFTIDGNQDIMFANQVDADKSNHFNNSGKRLQFNHLLTWVMVRVIASDFDAPASWGKVKSVKIKTAQDLTVTLGTGAVSYNATQDITVYEDATGVELQTTAVDIGETDASGELKGVFLAPATSFEVTVSTANVPTIPPVNVLLKDLRGDNVADAASTKGNVYVLTLYFNKFHVISASCTLAAWNDDYGIIYGTVS